MLGAMLGATRGECHMWAMGEPWAMATEGVFIVFSDQDLDAKAWGYKLSARVSEPWQPHGASLAASWCLMVLESGVMFCVL